MQLRLIRRLFALCGYLVEPIKKKEDVSKIEKYLNTKNERDRLIFVFGINTGLRVSDILNLNISDREYGFFKFIIIVPSRAIKEGTKNFIESDYANQHFSKFFYNKRIALHSFYCFTSQAIKETRESGFTYTI